MVTCVLWRIAQGQTSREYVCDAPIAAEIAFEAERLSKRDAGDLFVLTIQLDTGEEVEACRGRGGNVWQVKGNKVMTLFTVKESVKAVDPKRKTLIARQDIIATGLTFAEAKKVRDAGKNRTIVAERAPERAPEPAPAAVEPVVETAPA